MRADPGSRPQTSRPAYGRNSPGRQKRHQHQLVTSYLAGGGTVADFARIHRLPVSCVRSWVKGER